MWYFSQGQMDAGHDERICACWGDEACGYMYLPTYKYLGYFMVGLHNTHIQLAAGRGQSPDPLGWTDRVRAFHDQQVG